MAERKYLVEVQGLRSVAALLVALYHVWLQRVSGGVDVFFVVSAYFLTASLTRREPMRLRDLFARIASTVRRIVPGTAMVVIGTIAGSIFFLPEPLWRGGLDHALGSLAFVENWLLAAAGADYLQPRLVSSPFQQMWALSVQMQVLLGLPVVYFLCSLAGRLTGGRYRLVATLVFGLILAASLGWSVTATQADQAAAYYITTTRLWEFAAGALAALWIERVRLSPAVARLLGYAALAVLVSFGLVIDVSRQFPGAVAAVPVLCALGIIVASANGGTMRLLNNRAAVGFAELSFAFYLWHWPLLVFVRHAMTSSDVGLFGGVAIIAGAGLLAYASTRLVEAPVRRAAWLVRWPALSLVVAVAFIGLAIGAQQGWSAIYQARASEARAALSAYTAAPDRPLAPGQIVPDPIISPGDISVAYGDKCHQSITESAVVQCIYGDPDAPITLALVGGSHVTQWVDVFDAIGRAQGYRIVAMTKSGCTFTSDATISRSCTAWNDGALEALVAMRPDLVVALATRTSPDAAAPESIPLGYAAVFAKLEAQHIAILGLRDNPRFSYDVPNCVSVHRADRTACDRPRAQKLSDAGRLQGDMGPNISFVDIGDELCGDAICPAVKNGILVYRDYGHLTRTFTMRLAEQLAAATAAALGAGSDGGAASP